MNVLVQVGFERFEAVPERVPDVARSGRRVEVVGQLANAAELDADASDDDAWGPEAWRRVDAFLTGLGL